MTPRSLMAFCREKGVKSVEVRYTALHGVRTYIHLPVERLNEQLFETGLPLRGVPYVPRRSRECVVVPLADTAYLAPDRQITTLVLLAELQDSLTRREDELDPRNILHRAQEAWRHTGVGDTVLVAQSCDFFLTDSPASRDRNPAEPFAQSADGGGAAIDSLADHEPAGYSQPMLLPGGPLSHRVAAACGEAVRLLTEMSIEVEQVTYADQDSGLCRFHLMGVEAVKAADQFLMLREAIAMAAARSGLAFHFSPRVGPDVPRLRWQQRLSVWKDGEPQLVGDKLHGLSAGALAIAGGILRHLPAVMALTNPSAESLETLLEPRRPLRRAAIQASPSVDGATSLLYVPISGGRPEGKCIEADFADQTANPYLAIAALIMAGVAGVEENLSLDASGRAAGAEQSNSPGRKLPTSTRRAAAALRHDHAFLRMHEVFSAAALRGWLHLHRPTAADDR